MLNYFGSMGTDIPRRNGVLLSGKSIRLKQVTDGASQTLLLGERGIIDDFRLGLFFGWWCWRTLP